MKHTITLPLRLPSVANLRMHHMERAKLVAKQREAVTLAMKTQGLPRAIPELVITMTRIAPRPIKDEHDNLRSALKPTADSIAAWLGVDDSDHRLRWRYQQEKGPVGVRLDFEVRMLFTPSVAIAEHFERLAAIEPELTDPELPPAIEAATEKATPITLRTQLPAPKWRKVGGAARVTSERPVTTMRDLALMATSSIVRNRKG